MLPDMTQVAMPTDITPQEVMRETTLGGAIGLCAKVAGLEPKQVQSALHMDKAQWSRWESVPSRAIWLTQRFECAA